MVQAALRSGVADRRCVFEVFARRLPVGRRYGVVCGTGRIVEALRDFHFGDDERAFLARTRVVDETTLEWLSAYRFGGDVVGYREGELFFPGSPVLTVEACFAEAVLLETLVLSILNHDSAVAAAAARMVAVAAERPIIEMGGRRTHEDAAVAAARAAYLAGFGSTSNLECGRRYGVPTAGTVAHAFVLLHDDELAAFRAQVDALGAESTLLIDTYDVRRGARHAVEAAGGGVGAVRIDSGNLSEAAAQVRALLDEAGAPETRIVLTGDLDEYAIAALASCPVDGFGVGTSVVTGSGAPAAGFVYKLVARAEEAGADAPLRPVEKRSPEKQTRGGRKRAWRLLDDRGRATAELVTVENGEPASPARDLQVPVLRNGEIVWDQTLEKAREHLRNALGELGPDGRRIDAGDPALLTVDHEGGPS